jgi:hypothetical protein
VLAPILRWSIRVLVVVALALVLPAAASAETRYVAKGGTDAPGCTNPGAPCGTINYAVGQANGGDTIQIGPGSFTESVIADKALAFVGAGGGALGGNPAATTIVGPAGNHTDGFPAFELRAGGTLQALRAVGGHGDNSIATSGEGGGAGVEYFSSSADPTTLRLQDVVVIGGDGGAGSLSAGTAGRGLRADSGPGPVSVSAVGSDFAGGTGLGSGQALWVNNPGASMDVADGLVRGSYGSTIAVFSGARLALEAVDVDGAGQAAGIFDGLLTIRRSRLSAEGQVIYATGENDESPEVELVDSLVVSERSEAVNVESEEEGSASAVIVGSTLIGKGTAALAVEREEGAGPATATLRNSIARDLPFAEIIPAIDLRADGGAIDADFSSFTTRVEKNGGTVSAPGSAHNLAGDPGFLDPGHGVYFLQNTSSLIDRGDAGLSQPGELDLAGNPRSLDGNRDCIPAPDLGAFEVTGQSVPCPVDSPPTLSGFGMTNRVFAPVGQSPKAKASGAEAAARVKHGTRFTYTLSEPVTVTITIARKAPGRRLGKGGNARCAKVTAANKAGRHCVRFVNVTSLKAQEQGGRQSTDWGGRVHGKPSKPGRYRARAVAVDAAGQRSQPQQLGFRIVAG